MSPAEQVNIVIAVLTPVLTAGLGVLGLMIGDWRQRRTQAGRRKLAIEDAARQVDFTSAWWKVRNEVTASPHADQQATTDALAWLDEASALVAESTLPPVDKPDITFRRLLITYPMNRRSAQILRAAFYLALSVVPLFVGSVVSNILYPSVYVEPYSSGVWRIAAWTAIALTLRYAAVRVENSIPAAKPAGSAARNAMLLYRLDRPAARLVRVCFYITVLCGAFFIALGISILYDSSAMGSKRLFADASQFLSVLIVWLGWTVALRYSAVALDNDSRTAAHAVVTDSPAPNADRKVGHADPSREKT